MAKKKWAPMPEHIEDDLIARIKSLYSEKIKTLPQLGLPNPSISHEVTSNGFSAEVRFFDETGRGTSSLWEYTVRGWHMTHDWKD